MSPARLRDLGVLYWKLDPAKHESDPKLEAIRKKRGYSYQVRLFAYSLHQARPPGHKGCCKSAGLLSWTLLALSFEEDL